MRNPNEVTRQRYHGRSSNRLLTAIAAAAVLHPLAVHGARAMPTDQFEDRREARRVVIEVRAVQRAERGDPAEVVKAVGSGRLLHRAMLHRFTAELIDDAGQPSRSEAPWSLTVFASSPRGDRTAPQALVQLSAAESTVGLPSPLGYVLGAEDSIVIVALLGQANAGRHLRVAIEYDPFDLLAGRLGVVPLRASNSALAGAGESAPDDGPVTRTWEWTADVDGMLGVITGLPLAAARALVLRDAASGTVLWRTTFPSRAQEASYAPSDRVLRPGSVVRAGGVYTLTAVYNTRGLSGTPGCVQAVVIPTAGLVPR
jgi:hypothetical protein